MRPAAAATCAAAVLSLGVLGPGAACAPGGGDGDTGHQDTARAAEGSPLSERSIIEVQEARSEQWEALDGVVGTGVGECDGEPCIKVFAREESTEIEEEIPREVEGYPVRIEVTGPFRARDTSDAG